MIKPVRYFLISLWSLISLSSAAQTPATDASDVLRSQADSLKKKGIKLFTINLDSSEVYYLSAAAIYQKIEDWESYIKLLNGLAVVSYYKSDYETLQSYSQKAFDTAREHLGPSHSLYQDALNNLTAYYYNKGAYSKNDRLLKKILSLNLKNTNAYKQISKTYQNLGTNAFVMNNLQKALAYQKEALRYRQKSDELVQLELSNNYKDIGLTFQELGQYDSARVYLNKSLSIVKEFDASKFKIAAINRISTLHGLVEVMMLDQKQQAAKTYAQQALSLQKDDKAFRKAFTYELLARIDKEEGNYKQALENLQNANRLAQLNYRNNSYPKIARKLAATADLYEQLQQNQQALDYYQKGLTTLAPGYALPTSLANPPADQLLAPPDALNILHGKAQLLLQLAQQSADEEQLRLSLATFHTAADLIAKMRRGVLTTDAKNALAEKSVDIYEGAIATALALHQKTNDPGFLESAFRLAESNKALLLLESINARQASGFAGLPDSLREQEENLRTDLAFYQKKILEEKQKKEKADADKIKRWQEQIFKLDQQYDWLSSRLESDFPLYHKLKYQDNTLDLPKLQQQLASSSSALLEYFAGEKQWYVFVLTANGLQVASIDATSKTDLAIESLRQFARQSPEGGLSAETYLQFTQNAHELYQQLIRPATTLLPQGIEQLLIIPDYTLAFLPFDLLLTNPVQDASAGFHPDKVDYLLEQYLLSYDYSATLWSRSQEKENIDFEQPFIGFAPSFSPVFADAVRSCTSDQLYSLRCNQSEIKAIGEMLGGTQLVAKEAGKPAFEQYAAQSQILHLATHACVDEQDPMFSKIYLADDYLSIYDLYNTQLQSELVVLSACNTGSGKLLRGEGVMSLARGFMTAGCASTVMSLWSVDDCATSDIMTNFYKHLKEGRSKQAALRLAKLDYLASANKAQQHPYYWSAFVQYGNGRPLEELSTAINWILLGALLLAGIGFGLLWGSRRREA